MKARPKSPAYPTPMPDITMSDAESNLIFLKMADSPPASPPSTPTKPKPRRHRRTPSSTELLSIRVDQIYFVLKAIEKNTRPPPPSRTKRYRACISTTIMSGALALSFTMLYVLYVGYYSPTGIFDHIFFLDRLYDLRDLIGRLRDGTIFAAMARMMVDAFKDAVQDEMPRFGVPPLPYLPPAPPRGFAP